MVVSVWSKIGALLPCPNHAIYAPTPG
jgi:hypothetical protein